MSPVPFRHRDSYGPVPGPRKLTGPRKLGACRAIALALLALMLALPVRAGEPAGAADPVRAAEPIRVVAIGDSLTAGYGLPVEQGFLPQLANWLGRHGAPRFELVNMGVSGDTTAGGRARLDWALADGADAVILALGGNDLLRGVPPEETRRNLDEMLSELGSRGLPVLLIGIEATTNYGPEYKAEFDAIFPALAEKHGVLLDWWGLQRLAGQPEMAQLDGLHPSAAGVGEIVEQLGPSVLELIETVAE